MSSERFDHFLGFVENSIRKEDTNFCKAISSGERLAVTFRFLASEEPQQSLSFAYLTEEWENIARDFQETLVSMVAKIMLDC